jgi:hypothetical protein
MQGVIAGMVYNNLRLVDMSANQRWCQDSKQIVDNYPLHAGCDCRDLHSLGMAANKRLCQDFRCIDDNFPLHAGCDCRDGVQQPAPPGHGHQ